MAGVVSAVAPDGTPITVPADRVEQLTTSGGRATSAEEVAKQDADIAEANALRTPQGIAKHFADAQMASEIALKRGTWGAIGVPIDKAVTGVADLYGGDQARKSTAGYLKGLNERHPFLTAANEVAGAVGGTVAAGAIVGAPGAIGSAPMAGARGVAARMAVGGVENVVQATTKDINEAALGDKAVNGEAIVAQMPQRFLLGSLLTGGFEGGAYALGKGFSAATRRAIPAIEEGATRAIGREIGLEGEEALAAGARVRGLNAGEVPTSRKGIADLLEAEQAAQRGRSVAERGAAMDAMAGAQQGEAAGLAARREASLLAAAREGQRGIVGAEREASEGVLDAMATGGAGVESAELAGMAARRQVAGVAEHYGAAKSALQSDHEAAVRSLQEIVAEQKAVESQLTELAARASEEQAASKAAASAIPEGKISIEQFDEMVDTALGATGHSKDPNARWAIERTYLEAYGDQIHDPATAALTAAETTGSEATAAEAKRLADLYASLGTAKTHAENHLGEVTKAIKSTEQEARQAVYQAAREAPVRTPSAIKAAEVAEVAKLRLSQVERETASFIEKAQGLGAKEVAKAEKRGAARMASAQADAAEAIAKAEQLATREKAALVRKHEKQVGLAPKASEATDVDPLIASMAKPRGGPLVSKGSMWVAGAAAFHGNLPGAATALGSSFVAGQARNHGNLAAARALRGLSTTLSAVDDAIRVGATSILTGSTTKGAVAASNLHAPKGKEPTFEELSKGLLDAQANPLEMERRVRESIGEIAPHAPGTYQEVLTTTQRAQQYLLSILPEPQRDPGSLTPHLDPGYVSETAKYDFMKSARTVDDPLTIFADINNGSVTQAQVQAIQTVYPKLFDRMRNEVKRQTLFLTKPVDYEREIYVGVLLGQNTNQVLEPDFQVLLRKTYAEKSKQAESQNASGASGSKAAKNMMSGSESIEAGGQ